MASRRQDLDAIKAALDKGKAKKARFELPIPETTETQEGLKILNAPSQQQRHWILKTKVPPALNRWAMNKMGDEIGKYINDGLTYFMILVLVRRAVDEKSDPSEILATTPFIFPLRLRQKPLIPIDPIGLLKKYDRVLDSVKDILRKTQRNPINRIMTFTDHLPTTRDNAKRYCSMKASYIALDYLARKYRFPFAAEAAASAAKAGRQGFEGHPSLSNDVPSQHIVMEKNGLPPEALETFQSEGWWSRPGSNRRPLECHSIQAESRNPALGAEMREISNT